MLGANVLFSMIKNCKRDSNFRKLDEATNSQNLVKVVRDREIKEILSTQLVPGDLIKLESGMLVPTDILLIECDEMEVDESTVTKEN
jgi:Ca2+-transporting ATPase